MKNELLAVVLPFNVEPVIVCVDVLCKSVDIDLLSASKYMVELLMFPLLFIDTVDEEFSKAYLSPYKVTKKFLN